MSLDAALHLRDGGFDLSLVAVVTAAGLASAVLLGLALAAYARRQSRPFLLVALALAALAARSGVAVIALLGYLPPTNHHLVEHSLDVAMAALVVAAVYYARSVTPGERREGAR